MERILMILTSHRLDCFQLTMDVLRQTGALTQFEKVVLLLNGVEGKHLDYVNRITTEWTEVSWDTMAGPRGKGPLVAGPQNRVVEKYPNRLYFKIDEDIIVPPGWVDRMTAAYERHKDDPKLALCTPVVTNNSTGAHFLMELDPELAEEYTTRFQQPITHDVAGPVWQYPKIAEWIIRTFLNLEAANKKIQDRFAEPGSGDRFFDQRFSINNLVYDYDHWKALGGIPDDEEPAWTAWVREQGKHNVLVGDCLLHHYSFFVQQDWLDRTTLLEDLRAANLPPALHHNGWTRLTQRCSRIVRQIPRVLARRLKR